MIDERTELLYRDVVSLLRAAITGETSQLSEQFDIEKAYQIARTHHIYPLIYKGAVTCGVSRTHPVMQKLFHDCCNSALASERQIAAIATVSEEFERERIDYMFFKGTVVKNLYPSPDMRVMGDADVLIRMDQADKVLAVLERLGYKKKSENDQEYICESPDLCLEPHKYIASPANPVQFKYFGTGWDIAKRVGDSHAHELSDEDHLAYLIVHFAKHYVHGGIGLRHIVDFWIYRKCKPEMDIELLSKKLSELHLERFYKNICTVLDAWFEDANWNEMVQAITRNIFNSGSYGDFESRENALMRKRTKGKNIRFHSIVQLIFPSASSLRYEYPIINKLPWLLPAIWVVHWFRVLLFKRHRIAEQRKRLALLSQEKVDTFDSHLQYVGLDQV